MVLAVFFQVLGRYFFNFKLDMASETATFAQIWMVLIAAGLALQKNMHVGVDVLINILPKKIPSQNLKKNRQDHVNKKYYN